MKFWEIAGAQNVEFFHTKCVSKMGRVRSPKRRVRDDDFMFGLSSDYPSNRPYIGGNNLELRTSWQEYEGDFACSAHRKGRFKCDADQS